MGTDPVPAGTAKPSGVAWTMVALRPRVAHSMVMFAFMPAL